LEDLNARGEKEVENINNQKNELEEGKILNYILNRK